MLTQIGSVFAIRQKSNGRLVDAHTSSDQDFAVVTRPDQDDDTQRWVVLPFGDGSFTAQQLSTGRFLDAYRVRLLAVALDRCLDDLDVHVLNGR